MSVADVIDYLLENGPASKKELVENLDIGRSSIRQNLNKLHKWRHAYEIEKSEDYKGDPIWDVEERDSPKKNTFRW